MPTINLTSDPETFNAQVISWLLMANGDSGAPYTTPEFPDRTVQVEGTFGAGGTVLIEGSNDGNNYHVLSDFSGASLSFTSAGLKGVTENVLHLRPRVSGGDGTTSLNVFMLARRQP